jgi:hypothetical protein
MSEKATPDGCYSRRSGEVLVRQVARELVLVDTDNGVYHGLNEVGAQIWERLDGTRSPAEIARELSAHYPEVDQATLEADCLALVQELLDNDLAVAC